MNLFTIDLLQKSEKNLFLLIFPSKFLTFASCLLPFAYFCKKSNEALANELAAKFWWAKGKVEFAKIYLKNARYGYEIWGAKRKVKHLEAKYPQLSQSPIASTNSSPATVQQAYHANKSTFQSTTSNSNSVFRSGESVVLSDGCNEGNFTDRGYIQNYQVKQKQLVCLKCFLPMRLSCGKLKLPPKKSLKWQ